MGEAALLPLDRPRQVAMGRQVHLHVSLRADHAGGVGRIFPVDRVS